MISVILTQSQPSARNTTSGSAMRRLLRDGDLEAESSELVDDPAGMMLRREAADEPIASEFLVGNVAGEDVEGGETVGVQVPKIPAGLREPDRLRQHLPHRDG